MTNNPVQNEYKMALAKLIDFCKDNTDLEVLVLDDEYPFTIQFIPKMQIDLFVSDLVNDQNVNENGEVNYMTVSVGLRTSIKSTLLFKMDAKLLKKLIRMSEKIGILYYHAFRASAGGPERGE